MVEKVRVDEKWYILATASPADERRRVLKHNELFGMFDRFGDIQSIGLGEEGLYLGDTCFLSHQELLIDGVRPMFLNSTVRDDNGLLVVELMNPDLHPRGASPIMKGEMHIFRAKLLWNNTCYEHIRIVNFGLERVSTVLSMELAADYKDIFEVRGFVCAKRGERIQPRTSERELVLGYKGRDDSVRRTRIRFDPAPHRLDGSCAEFRLDLEPKAEVHLYVSFACERDEQSEPEMEYFSAFKKLNQDLAGSLLARSKITTSDPLFNKWLDRSAADLVMLTTKLEHGDFPYAGLPWYATTFGRDGIITAREYLWIDPGLAKGVLGFLAATQARELDPERDAEPGKILHEARQGELAALNEIPFRRYYGTIDATPMFVALAGGYYERTGDLDTIRAIWPNIRAALHWIDHYGDRDGDGFVEYARYTETGLAQQGWKDSHDSVFHADGRLAEGPIALCEVQGYVYEAKVRAAKLADLLGEPDFARELCRAAEQLKTRFNEAFWCEQIGTYALALDGAKKQCAVRSSNAGHALSTGIATPEYAQRVAAQLLGEDFFCGWGIRTIPAKEARYNPMAYHNGSVWPHDNAIIAEGMARYGLHASAMKVFSALNDAAHYMDQSRMPELFCGFERRPDEGPTLYPVACSPQAWSAAAVFSLLQACLRLSFDTARSEIRFRHPQLPHFLDTVEIRDLAINGAKVDLLLQRYPNNVGVNVLRKVGNIEVVMVA
jgi:glycogen debranching enzyme